MSTLTEYTIRKIQRSDIPAILSLVKELAEFEKDPGAVSVTEQDYYEDFDANVYDGHIAVCNEQIVGMVIYYMTYSTWKGRMLYLEDFVVTLAHRNKGLGQLLFNTFLQEAKEQKAKLVKWQVLDWNEDAIRFYQRQGAEIEKQWYNGKIIF